MKVELDLIILIVLCWFMDALNIKVGVAEMKVAVERTGGLVVLSESFGHSVFKDSFKRVFEDGEQSLGLCFKWEFSHFKCSTDIFFLWMHFLFSLPLSLIFSRHFLLICYQTCSLPTLFMFQWNPRDKLLQGNKNSGNYWTLHLVGKGWIFFCLKLLISCCLSTLELELVVGQFTELRLNQYVIFPVFDDYNHTAERAFCCWYCYRRGKHNSMEDVWPWQEYMLDCDVWSFIKWSFKHPWCYQPTIVPTVPYKVMSQNFH